MITLPVTVISPRWNRSRNFEALRTNSGNDEAYFMKTGKIYFTHELFFPITNGR